MTDTALLQERVGAPATDVYDQATENAVVTFQQSRGITPSGNPDPATLTAAGVYDPIAGAARRFQGYLQGGSRPGTFGRDLSTAMNQVPWWGYFVVGVGLSGLAFLAYRRRGPQKPPEKKRKKQSKRR